MPKKRKTLDEPYRMNARWSRRKRWIWILLAVLVVVAVGTMFFRIKEVRVTGTETVSAEQLKSDLGIREGMNMFYFLIASKLKTPQVSPRIESVDVYVDWPDALDIEVKERTVVAYVSYMGMYLCLDEAGYVIDSTYYLGEEMPVITGIQVKSFRLGEPLNTSSTSLSQTIMEICMSLRKYGIAGEVVRVDMTDTSDTRLYTERLEIRMGETEDIDLKMQAFAAILKKTPDAEGILHLEDLEGQIYLEKNL